MRKQREYQGGYARIKNLNAILRANKEGRLSKEEIRIFLAIVEAREANNGITPNYILSNNSSQKRNISEQTVLKKIVKIKRLIELYKPEKEEDERTTKVPREFLKVAASGALSRSEMISFLAYCRFRMPQRSRWKGELVKGERYARFTYQKIREFTGLAKSTITIAITKLKSLGLIAVLWRPMEEIKRHGRCYVDGIKLNLFSTKEAFVRASNPYKKPKIGPLSAKNRSSNNKTLPKNSFKGLFEMFVEKSAQMKAEKTAL